METRVLTEEELGTYADKIPDSLDVTYLKLIGFTKGFLEKVAGDNQELQKGIEGSNGFVLLCPREQLRDELHSLVDRFCDSKEKKDNE